MHISPHSASPKVVYKQANNKKLSIFKDVTWSSPVSGGVQSVKTPEECQLLCADTNDCDSVTWYGSNASPHPDYCEMFMFPAPTAHQGLSPAPVQEAIPVP